VFYDWWDWQFLSLVLLSTIVDYFVGLKIYDSNDKKTKKSYLWISILFNLGLLGFFKYFIFFIDSWIDFLGAFGYEHQSTWTLKVILPVGISFYTFQTISYSLDIYFKKLKLTKDFISFASFVSFFPQLVAGPIERASNLLPQILNKRLINNNYNKLTMLTDGSIIYPKEQINANQEIVDIKIKQPFKIIICLIIYPRETILFKYFKPMLSPRLI
jgi:alginate O-acetyltransferase complex protein AlgI